MINVVSKMPTPDRFAEVGVRAGGYRFGSPWIDVNQPLNASKTALFRLTAHMRRRIRTSICCIAAAIPSIRR